MSLAEARAAFQRGGFSVVINSLQRRWRGVSEVALALEDVLGQPVNANLYMTPPGRQGFEAHFDWMDGASRGKAPIRETMCFLLRGSLASGHGCGRGGDGWEGLRGILYLRDSCVVFFSGGADC